MPLTEKEQKLLNELKQKEAIPLSNNDLERMEQNISDLFEYHEAFKALMIWNQFSEKLSTLATDNSCLIAELKQLRSEIRNKTPDLK